jgi:hypothetical protein
LERCGIEVPALDFFGRFQALFGHFEKHIDIPAFAIDAQPASDSAGLQSCGLKNCNLHDLRHTCFLVSCACSTAWPAPL